MDDLISRQAAIDAIHRVLFDIFDLMEEDHESPMTEKDLFILKINKVVCNSINALPAVQRVEDIGMRWIPCAEDEPEEDQECWITVKTTDTIYRGDFTRRYGERRNKGFITTGGFMWWNTALAWMPVIIPEPYKEEE